MRGAPQTRYTNRKAVTVAFFLGCIFTASIFSVLTVTSRIRIPVLDQIPSLSHSQAQLKSKSPPSVAFVICLHSAPKNSDGSFAVKSPEDGTLLMAPSLAVLAKSVRRIGRKSRYQTHLVALVRRNLVSTMQEGLKGLGFEVIPTDRLVDFDEMMEPGKTRAQTDKLYFSETLIYEENDKLYIYNMTQYDRVVLLDTDVLMVQPIDEILDDPAETLGTLDYYALGDPGDPHPEGGMKLSVVPPINAGFVVVRPSKKVFAELQEIIRRGNFRTGQTKEGYVEGWDGLGLGYFFGGISIQGVLPAYYFRHAVETRGNATRFDAIQAALRSPTRKFRELDQCVYNVLGHKNCWGHDAGVQGTCRNVDCSPEANPTLEVVKQGLKAVHFTGTCNGARPWVLCKQPAVNREKICELCQEFMRIWTVVALSLLSDEKHTVFRQLAPTLPSCLEKLQE